MADVGDDKRGLRARLGGGDSYALRFPVIALVTSAGGLDALSHVLAALPGDLPAAVLVVQHQQPEHPSRLAVILDHRSELAVVPAANGDELVRGRCWWRRRRGICW